MRSICSRSAIWLLAPMTFADHLLDHVRVWSDLPLAGGVRRPTYMFAGVLCRINTDIAAVDRFELGAYSKRSRTFQT
jgi:hypothetical protein